jgi:DNA polymerase (family X)
VNNSNQAVAKLLRSVAAALNIKKASIFQVRAYETAADAIEHLTSSAKDLWEEEKLDLIPGVGENLQNYLSEYFKTGKVSHFESVVQGIPPQTFDFLDISGVGPKTALELSKIGVKNLENLEKLLKNGELTKRGFSEKIAAKILLGLNELTNQTGRMLLPYASEYAQKILEYLKKGPGVVAADPLGSLRRQVATIGDLDFAAAAEDTEKVVDYFTKMPGTQRVLDKGPNKANTVLNTGLEVDLLVGKPNTYGALLQHFTGSKHHNIKLRTHAEKKGLSLSEYGVKETKTSKVIPTKTEEEIYKMLNMQTPAPEMREDAGEIEAAISGKLPKVIEFRDIKGDFHLHSNFPLEPSHGPGINDIEEIVDMAVKKKYEYVGISDHSPSFTNHSKEQILKLIEKRTKVIQEMKKNKKSIRVLNGLEIDILGDGSLSVPDEALKTLDYCIAGIHSGHKGTKEVLTKRILKALESPYIDIISHPTGRLLNQRDSYDADWEVIFKYAAKYNKLMEINAFPNRLDLRDDLVRMAVTLGVKFIIDTDAHQVSQMDNMPFGVSVARRGWVEAKDVVNTWQWKDLAKWFSITN